MAEIIDRAFSCKTPSALVAAHKKLELIHATAYSTILELDNMITQREHDAVPLGFKNPSITDIVEKPYIKDQYMGFQIRKIPFIFM